jgi:cytochrome c oxidase subunit II
MKAFMALFFATFLTVTHARSEDAGSTISADVLKTIRESFDLLTSENLDHAANADFTIVVTGKQHEWSFAFPPDGNAKPTMCISTDTVAVPQNARVALMVTSDDIIHEFLVPGLNLKAEAVPGRLNLVKVDTSKPGTYSGSATSLSGKGYESMTFNFQILSPADYAAWAKSQITAQTCLKE